MKNFQMFKLVLGKAEEPEIIASIHWIIEKTTECKRLEVSSRKLEITREYFMQDEHNKGQKWYGLNRSRRY